MSRNHNRNFNTIPGAVDDDDFLNVSPSRHAPALNTRRVNSRKNSRKNVMRVVNEPEHMPEPMPEPMPESSPSPRPPKRRFTQRLRNSWKALRGRFTRRKAPTANLPKPENAIRAVYRQDAKTTFTEFMAECTRVMALLSGKDYSMLSERDIKLLEARYDALKPHFRDEFEFLVEANLIKNALQKAISIAINLAEKSVKQLGRTANKMESQIRLNELRARLTALQK